MDFSACVVTAVCLSISNYLFFPTKIAAAAHATASPSHLVVSLLHIRREAAADWWLHAESREPVLSAAEREGRWLAVVEKQEQKGEKNRRCSCWWLLWQKKNRRREIKSREESRVRWQCRSSWSIYTDPGSYKGHTMLFSWAISRLSWAQSCCIRAGSGAAPKCKFLFYLAGAPRLVLDHDAA